MLIRLDINFALAVVLRARPMHYLIIYQASSRHLQGEGDNCAVVKFNLGFGGMKFV